MTKWQRWARLLVAIFAIGFAVMVAFAFKRRAPVAPPEPSGRTDPNAVVESTTGRVMKFSGAREDVTVEYQKQSTYKDGTSNFQGVTVTSEERGGTRTFVITAAEAVVGANESTITMNGKVALTASDGLVIRGEQATYTEADATVRVPGPVAFARKRLSGSGVGMTYDNKQDVLVILDQAHLLVAADAGGAGATEITSPTATVARRDKYLRFERGIKALRGGQVIEADSSVAHLKDDQEHIDRIELRGNSKITEANAAAGALQALTGRDIDLKYGADGETLEHALIVGDSMLQIAGQQGAAGPEIVANLLDLTLAPDGTTPVALTGRDAVQLTFPADPGAPTRVVKAATLDARGEAKTGLTHAAFTGEVDYRERGTVPRAAKAETMDLALKPGMSSIDAATFTRNVRFSQEGGLFATAAAGRYVLDQGTLELHGTEPGALRPHITNEQIDVDANQIDVVLAGPVMKATGEVKSVLQPARKDSRSKDVKMPSMLKGDKPVNVMAGSLDYDGTLSKATYRGEKPKLWQGETTIQGDELTIDNQSGDLLVSGSAATRTMLEQGDKNKKPRDRIRSIGTAKDFKYEEALQRATYTGDAHLSGPQGDMTADRIELFLKPSGDEIDRAEAYGTMTLREQNRTTTGERLTYTTSDETYVITGLPVTILDECGRPTEGQTLTFVKATDTVNIDGGDEIRTRTKGGGGACR